MNSTEIQAGNGKLIGVETRRAAQRIQYTINKMAQEEIPMQVYYLNPELPIWSNANRPAFNELVNNGCEICGDVPRVIYIVRHGLGIEYCAACRKHTLPPNTNQKLVAHLHSDNLMVYVVDRR